VLVHPPGGMAPIEVLEEDPPYERFLRTLGGYGSLLVYDFVGKGASDPFDPELDFVDQNADCFVAVLDACEIEKAWLVVGDAQGAPLARRVATRYPDRLNGEAVLNPPGGRRRLSVDNILVRDDSSNDLLIRGFMPSRADDPAFRAWPNEPVDWTGSSGPSSTARQSSTRPSGSPPSLRSPRSQRPLKSSAQTCGPIRAPRPRPVASPQHCCSSSPPKFKPCSC
jgi:pimeloyl-ACP methyl ester carboxylesterase